MNARFLAGLTVLVLFVPISRADEKADELEKQKAAAEANWKKMEFEKPPPMVETAHFLLLSRTPEARTKAFGASLDKFYATMLKPLDYKGDDKPWPGKLAVYVFTDRSEFVSFMRKVVKKSPKEDESSYFAFKAEESLLVVGMPRGGKVDAEFEAKHQLASAVLQRKMGSGEPPEWVAQGFAEASIFRAANPSLKGKGAGAMPSAPVSEIWGDNLSPAVRQKYATYIMDFLAYGPMSDQFPAFVGAFRPDENGNSPGVDAALKAMNLDAGMLQAYAKSWTKPKAAPAKPKKPDKN